MSQYFTNEATTAAMPSIDVNFQTGRGNVIPSVSIERIIANRARSLAKVAEAVDLLKEAEIFSQAAGGGDAKDWASQSTLFGKQKDDILTHITKVNDLHIWTDLMNKSGMLTLMDEQARSEWQNNLQNGHYPEVTYDNIMASFEQLDREKYEVFERGVINLFKSLSWDYKTNAPCRFGKKIIMNHVVSYHPLWGFSSNYSAANKLNDLERILNLMDGKPVPDHRSNVSGRLSEHINASRKEAAVFNDEYFSLRYFKKQSGHVTFTRPDLIDTLNDILVKHYPGALPSRV